jgi:hypothetical protein
LASGTSRLKLAQRSRGEPFHLDQSAIKALSPLIQCDLRAIGYALAKINLQVLI